MKKIVYLDQKAQKTLNKLSKIIQNEFYARFKVLKEEGKLEYPYAKRINKDLFEIRVKSKSIYRAFYAYVQTNYIIILHLFNKKTQKTPIKEIRTARRRLANYE